MKRSFKFHFFRRLKISFSREKATSVMNFLLRNRIEFQGYYEAEEIAYLFCPKNEEGRLRALSDTGGYIIEGGVGITEGIKRSVRPGLLVGGALAAFLILFSGLFVWEVRISGNSDSDDDRIIEELRAAGFGVGSFLPTVNLDRVKNSFLQNSEDIGWISINLKGRIAEAVVIEKNKIPVTEAKGSCVNLIADTDAVICEIAVEKGTSVVKRGSVVKKGDLLVSGILPGAHETEFVTAKGKIYGECKKEFTVEIPFVQEEKKAVSQKKQKITLNFFGYPINIYEDTGNLTESCDTIVRKEDFTLFGIIFPVSYTEVYSVYYEASEKRLTEEETVLLARRELSARMTAALPEAELISRRLYGEFTETGYRLTAEIVAITDIARELPFTVSGKNQG